MNMTNFKSIKNSVMQRIEKSINNLPPIQRKIADYIVKNPNSFINIPLSEFSSRTNASEGTIINFCRNIGFRGYKELKINLMLALENVSGFELEDVAVGDQCEVAARKMAQAEANTILDTLRNINMEDLKSAVELFKKARKIWFLGCGISGIVAHDSSQRFLRLGYDTAAVIDPHVMMTVASLSKFNDIFVGISHFGQTKQVVDAIRKANELGAFTISITNYPNSLLTKYCNINLFTSSSETILRGAAITSRIAQLSIIDMLFASIVSDKDEYEKLKANIELTREAVTDLRYK